MTVFSRETELRGSSWNMNSKNCYVFCFSVKIIRISSTSTRQWNKHVCLGKTHSKGKKKKSMQHCMVSVTLFFCSPIVHRWNKQRILDFWSALQISEHFVTLYLIPGGLTGVHDFKSTILQLLLASSVTINRNTLFWLTLCSLKLEKNS